MQNKDHVDLEVFVSDNKPTIENEIKANFSRRHFLRKSSIGLGSIALASLLSPGLLNGKGYTPSVGDDHTTGVLGKPHFPPKVKRVIYLFQSGGPSQIDLYDHKPFLNRVHQQEVPESVFNGQRLTGRRGSCGDTGRRWPWKFRFGLRIQKRQPG